MFIWGIVGNSHDASVAVFDKEEKIGLFECCWAGMSKDFSGIDHDPHLNWEMLQHITITENLPPPDKIVWYEKPFKKSLRQLQAGQGWLFKENNIKQYLSKWNLYQPISYVQHHRSHAAYGYYTSGLDNATIMCLDSIGEFETFTIWEGKGAKLKQVFSGKYPHSVGLFYSAMTQRLGLEANKEEYKVSAMGSEIATSENLELVTDMVETFIEGPLNGSKPGVKFKHNLHKGCDWYKPDLTTEHDMKRLADATQYVFEMIVQSNNKWCLNNLSSRNLILTGGCALNNDAVRKIRKDWNYIYVPKNPGDPGSCIGAVLALESKHIDFDQQVWYNK